MLPGMQRLRHVFVWLSRIGYSRGFGIQSPTDYAFVRYVVNEHWPYYQYDSLGKGDDWLTRKLGLLYFRIANWQQPRFIQSNDYLPYLQAGCRTAVVNEKADCAELIHLRVGEECRSCLAYIYNKVDGQSVLILEDIRKDMALWQEVKDDERTGVTFDLYYCGIVMFDLKRQKQHYMINF